MAERISEKQFNELEKRIFSFKANFGSFNSHTAKGLDEEGFPKSFNITPENIINNSNDILFTNTQDLITELSATTAGDFDKNDSVKPFRVRTWILHPDTSLNNVQRIARGSFSSSFTGHTENPFVERIIMPITEVEGTDGQFYVAYGAVENLPASSGSKFTGGSSGGGYGSGARPKFKYNSLRGIQSGVLKNFLPPSKFGNGYKVQMQVGDINDYTFPSLAVENTIFEAGDGGKYEGFIFDFTEGFVFKASSGEVRDDTTDTDSTYTPFNKVPSLTPGVNFDTFNPLDPPQGGDDGEMPVDNTVLSGYTTPYWISAYRYIGPTGFNHPSASIRANIISASDIQVDNNLNIDGNLSFEGINFVSNNILSNSGSSVFGDDVNEDTHRFTGSVFISGGLFVDGVSTAGGGGGTPGIVTSIFPNPSSSTEHGNFLKTSLFPTDKNDILEYRSVVGLKISSSIGSASYIILQGSESLQGSTYPNRDLENGDSTPIFFDIESQFGSLDVKGFGPNNDAIDNPADLFRFHVVNGKDFPVLSSYAPFTASKTAYTTHSIELSSSIVVPKISIYFSRDTDNTVLSSVQDSLHYSTRESGSIEAIKFSGSHDGNTWVGLYSENNIRINEGIYRGKFIHENPINPQQINQNLSASERFITRSYTVGTDPEFPLLTNNPSQFGINLANGVTKTITKYTTLNFQSNEYNSFSGTVVPYKYYRLHISGGTSASIYDAAQSINTQNKIVQWIHHIDLFRDLNLTGSNRKQINISFDEDPNPTRNDLTNFQFAVSNSLAAAGLVTIEPADNAVILGTAQQNLDLNNNNLLRVNILDSTKIENSGNITNGGNLTNNGNVFIQGGLHLNENGTFSTSTPAGSIVLESENPIFFTNKKQDGTSGVDQFSGRIFGHTTTQGVNDLYIDAHRIYYISDSEHHIQTLNLGGLIEIRATKIELSGSVTASGNISASGIVYASNFFKNGVEFTGGGGSGFPHDQNSGTQITASITGSLIISGSNESAPPHITLGSYTDNNLFDINANQNIHRLHNYNGALYWGNDELSSGVGTTQTITDGELGNNFDLNSHDISGSGNIIINGNISGSGFSSSGDLSIRHITASGNISASGTIIGATGSFGVITNINTNHVSASGNISSSETGIFKELNVNGTKVLSHSIGLWRHTPSPVESNNYITSSRNILVKGNISSSGAIYLNGGVGGNPTEKVLSIGNSSNQLFLGSNLNTKAVSVDFTTVGTVFTILNKGDVGIGNTNPTEKLVVNGTISASQDLIVKGFIKNPNIDEIKLQSHDHVLSYNVNNGDVNYVSVSSLGTSGGGGSTEDLDWFIKPTFLTSSKRIIITGSITSSGGISSSGNLYGKLPIANKFFPVVTQNNLESGIKGRLELSPGILVDAVSESTGGNGIVIGGPESGHGVVTIEPDLIIKKEVSHTGRRIKTTGIVEAAGFVPTKGHTSDIGDPNRPFKDLHIDRGTIRFYSGSTADSSSIQRGAISFDDNERINFRAGVRSVSSVQIAEESLQGFVAVNKNGEHSTILRAQNSSFQALGDDFVAGSITQKGSGSFQILLDADDDTNRAKFGIRSNTGVAGSGDLLLTVSESGETRAYNSLKVDKHITASGNVSGSSTTTASFGHIIIGGGNFTSASLAQGGVTNFNDLTNKPTLISSSAQFNSSNNVIFGNITATNLNVTSITSSIVTSSILQTEGSNIFGDSNSDTHKFNGNITASGNISASSNLIGSDIFGGRAIIDNRVITPELTSLTTLTIVPDITASGNISSSGNIFSNIINGQAFNINGTPVIERNTNDIILAGASTFTSIQIGKQTQIKPITLEGNITASGNISASGDILAKSYFVEGQKVLSTDDATLTGELFVNNNTTKIRIGKNSINASTEIEGNITSSGNISSSGTIIGSNLSGVNTGDQDLSSLALKSAISGAFIAPSASFSTRVTANDAKISYTDAAVTSVINTAGVLSSSAQLPNGIYSSSLQILGNITSSGNISASGEIRANTFNAAGNVNFNGKLDVSGTTTLDGSVQVGSNGNGNNITFFSNTTNGFIQFGASTNTLNLSRGSLVIGDGTSAQSVAADNQKITVNGNVSASGIITAATMSIAGVYTDGQSPIQFRDDVRIFDGSELRIGDGPSGGESSDLRLYHDGTDSYIKNSTGEFIIEQSTGDTTIKNFGTDDGIKLILDKNPINAAVGSTGTVLISGSANPGIRLDVRGDITASGNISSSGDIKGNNLIGTIDGGTF